MLSLPKFPPRFAIKKKLGEGAFSKLWPGKPLGDLYSALDNETGELVALKVEKSDKSKKVLQLEYQILSALQGKCIDKVKDCRAFAQFMSMLRTSRAMKSPSRKSNLKYVISL